MYKNKEYSFLSKILHHLALGNNFIPEMLHDIELTTFKKKIEIDNLKPHIFVCGLPRSGTTILMRSLYETKQFASLTYRDMPFVVLPNLWSKVSNRIKPKPHKTRIHDDKISIDIDSPEALEEIFWRVKLQKKYIFPNQLKSHQVDEFTINEFRNFVSLILLKYKKKTYLSKNNNNLLRLSSIKQIFPNSLILIPFRDPLQQANSLLKQHKHFSILQKKDRFIKKYMTYLVHHEFGLDHRPYQFNSTNEDKIDRNTLNYWLDHWVKVYSFLLNSNLSSKKNIFFINYEFLCKNHKVVLSKILENINIKDAVITNSSLKLSSHEINVNETPLLSKAKEIFSSLKKINNDNFL